MAFERLDAEWLPPKYGNWRTADNVYAEMHARALVPFLPGLPRLDRTFTRLGSRR